MLRRQEALIGMRVASVRLSVCISGGGGRKFSLQRTNCQSFHHRDGVKVFKETEACESKRRVTFGVLLGEFLEGGGGSGGGALRRLDLNIRRANKMSANQRNGSLSS